MTELSDEELMQQICSGKTSGLAILFERYQIRLYNFFLKLTFDQMLSEDLTQQLFLRLIKYKNSYNPESGRFKSWFYQSARNIYWDHVKSQQRSSFLLSPVNERHEDIPEAETDYSETDFQRLDRCLAYLTPENREVIVLSRYEGLKYEQIASIMNSSVPAIKVRVHRAIKELRAVYFND